MSNNCIATTTTSVIAGATTSVLEIDVADFKSIKMILMVRNPTTLEASASEVLLSYSVGAPVTVYQNIYSQIGATISYVVSTAYVALGTKVVVSVTNNEANTIEVDIGEIERIE